MDDLAAGLTHAQDAIADGAANPGSPWRQLALATVGLDGRPQIRTLVLRAYDRMALTLDLHSDARSAKIGQLRACPNAALHGWNPASGEQLRIEGRISLHASDQVAETAWQSLRPQTRDTYRALPAPGTPIDTPEDAGRTLGDADAFAAFAVLRLHIEEIEYLLIDPRGHRRARFTWAAGSPTLMWLAP